MHLRHRIAKIKELEGDMIERYGKYYERDKGVPLPEKVRKKLNFYSSIALNAGVRRCI
jgi:hypothetical protein